MQPTVEPGLKAFQSVDFSWFTQLRDVWTRCPSGSLGPFQAHVDEILAEAARLKPGSGNRLGRVLLGAAGHGKTFLLGHLRSQAILCNAQFVLVDMSDVRDFWLTVAQGFTASLQQDSGQDRTQLQRVLMHLLYEAYTKLDDEREALDIVAGFTKDDFKLQCGDFLNLLRTRIPEVGPHLPVVRALVMLESRDAELQSMVYSWLQGQSLEPGETGICGLPKQIEPIKLVASLSWAMARCAPTVVAFDQLDPIVAQHKYAAHGADDPDASAEQTLAMAILNGITGGLTNVMDQLHRSVVAVCCNTASWTALQKAGLESFRHRFLNPATLTLVPGARHAETIITSRLTSAYERARFQPKYAAWPFSPQFFDSIPTKGISPRELLQRCDQHLRACSKRGGVFELLSYDPNGGQPPPDPPLDELDHRYANYCQIPLPPEILDAGHEDVLGDEILAASQDLIREFTPGSHIDISADGEATKKTSAGIHARIRLTYRNESDREEHFLLRVLQHLNPMAFKARITGAMIASGIDKSLRFRDLSLLRSTPLPAGPRSQELTNNFRKQGGRFVTIEQADLRAVRAVAQLRNDPHFEDWLRLRRPLSRLALFQPVGQHLERILCASQTPPPNTDPPPGNKAEIVIGKRLLAGQPGEPVKIQLAALATHVAIRAGSGGGKTVLVKRLIEAAAIQGVPAIVLDVANDLAQLGDSWPQPPEHWFAGDRELARRYHDSVETVIWTPGLEAGRPLSFSPLPDFISAREDAHQLDVALEMATDSIGNLVITGNGNKATKMRGVLASALRRFAQGSSHTLTDLIALLSDLPHEASGGIGNAPKLAAELADLLRSKQETNRLLRQTAPNFDPAELFGIGNGRTRISIVSMIGLANLEEQQQFVNQLAVRLFTWIKKNPPKSGRPTGLLVIDEAKNFLPGQRTTPCKASLIRLAAEARKYGLGIVLATQNPKDIDYTAAGQCSTQFYGLANMPQVIEFIQSLVAEKGGSASDIGKLGKGQFYMWSASGVPTPIGIQAPMCLSHHPANQPLTESQVVERAKRNF